MHLRLKTLAVCGALTFMAACGVDAEEQSLGLTTSSTQALKAASTGANDNGTSLSATAAVTATTCTNEQEAQVDLATTVTTTGSVDSAVVTVSVDGAEATEAGVIQPQDFSHDGRIKTASFALSLTLANGEHSVQVCFTQSGAQGRLPKTTCAEPVSVTVDCAPKDVCEGAEAFGDLVGSPSLCTGHGPPHIPVHVKGDFGEDPALTIAGPGGFSFSATMDHAGESCVYQYNWEADPNGGAGTYTFTVTGNGNTYSFTADLACQSH